MLRKIMTYVSQFNMIEPGDCIVAGVSGGADSVGLFYVLLEIKKTIPFTFCVVHVNHMIRREADGDEAYVAELCRKERIAFYPVREDVAELARQKHLSEEEAGRQVRYEAFERIRKTVYGEAGKIAVAHTQNDRAETFLFNLFRGTGLTGLTGIAPVRGNIIRPMLCVDRCEIEAWLSQKQIVFLQDATNATDAYARNRIRRHILPYADREICRGSAAHINKTADLLGQAADYLEKQVQQAFAENAVRTENGIQLYGKQWTGLDPYIKQALVHEVFKRLTPAAKDITTVHVREVCGLFEKQVGKSLHLPYRITALRNYDGVILERNVPEQKEKKDCAAGGESERVVALSGEEGEAFFAGYRIRWRVFRNEKGAEVLADIPKNDCTKWFDYDKINRSIVFRYRRTGDFIAVNEQGGTKRVKEYMIHEKIPSAMRDSIPLLAEENRILWIVGYRIGQNYKISSQTKNIMEIQISGGK